jgi:hypothetical protein
VSTFLGLLKALVPTVQPRLVRDEAYLAQSVDIYDLERRMQELDRQQRGVSQDLVYSLGLR